MFQVIISGVTVGSGQVHSSPLICHCFWFESEAQSSAISLY